jgi:hypothetical protein
MKSELQMIKERLKPYKLEWKRFVWKNSQLDIRKKVTIAIILFFISYVFFNIRPFFIFWHELGHALAAWMCLNNVLEFHVSSDSGFVVASGTILPWFFYGAGAGFGIIFPFFFWWLFNKAGLDYLATFFIFSFSLMKGWGRGADFGAIWPYANLALICYIALAVLSLFLTIRTYVKRHRQYQRYLKWKKEHLIGVPKCLIQNQ